MSLDISNAFIKQFERETHEAYIMAVTWAAQMLALAWTILEDPAHSGDVINSMSSLSTIWSVGLAVLGVYVYKRSEEKGAKAAALPGPLAMFSKN